MKNYNVNYVDNTIEMTKKFAKAAGVLNTPEYKDLLAKRGKTPQVIIQ